MQVIQAGLSHLEQVANLFDLYRQFYQQPADAAGAKAFIKARMTAQESVIFLAVNEQQQGLGFTQLYPSFTSVGMQRSWTLNDLFVSPVARQQGVARALMMRAAQLAKDTQASSLNLMTATDNHQAQALYEDLGYQKMTGFYQYSLKCTELIDV